MWQTLSKILCWICLVNSTGGHFFLGTSTEKGKCSLKLNDSEIIELVDLIYSICFHVWFKLCVSRFDLPFLEVLQHPSCRITLFCVENHLVFLIVYFITALFKYAGIGTIINGPKIHFSLATKCLSVLWQLKDNFQ